MTYEDFRAGELQGWDTRAEAYDMATARATAQAIPDLLAAVRLAPGMRVLDVCCGPGYAAGAAAALGAETRGVDFAPGMVRQAREQFPGLAFDEGDAEHLAFPDASFDAVLCNFGLFHVTAPDRAMSEAFRVLRRGGRYAFSQWCTPEENPVHRLTLGIVRRVADMSIAPPAPDAFTLSDRDTAHGMDGTGWLCRHCPARSADRAARTRRGLLRLHDAVRRANPTDPRPADRGGAGSDP